MATPFESNAEEFVGARPSSASSSYEIPDAPKLSNSTRRMISAREVFAEQAYDSSLMARRENSMERQRVDMDAARSQLYDQDMERRRKEAEWYDREETRKQGMAAMDRISKLMPNSPTYLEEKSKIMGDLPMAGLDKNVAAVFVTKDKIYDEAQRSREKAQELKIKSEDRVANREDTQAAQLDASRINREESHRYNVERDIMKYSPEAQKAYQAAIASGKTVLDASVEAQTVDDSVMTEAKYRTQYRKVNDLNREISRLRTELAKVPDALSASDPVFMEQYEADKKELRQELEDQRVEREYIRDKVLRPYEAKFAPKGGRPEPKPSSPTVATRGLNAQSATVEQEAPVNVDAPTVSLQDAIKRTGNRDLQIGQVLNVPVKTGSGETKFKQYIISK